MNDLLLPAVQKGAAAQDTDPYYNLVSLHLKGDVNTRRTYNAFSDASSNNFRLTNNGDVRGSSFSPYNTSWSNYFSGSSQYLSVADSTAFTMGSGDFTIEYWTYFLGGSDLRVYGQFASSLVLSTISFFGGNSSGNKVLNGVYSGTTGYTCTSTADMPTNQWVHIAFVRDGNTLRQYINGVQDGTSNVTGVSINDSSTQLSIGRAGEYAAQYWNGHISNFRIVKGRCVYPSGTTFTPPTAPLTRTTGGTNPPQGTECSLLTCQSNRFIDNSIANTGGTPFTITANGSPTVSSFSPFLETDTTTGSGYFDGTGDFLSFANDTALQLSNSTAYTIETWVYLNSLTADGGTAGPLILDCYNQSSPYPGYALGIGVGTVGSGNFEFWDGTAWNVIGAASTRQWLHVAVSYEGSGTTRRFFINGKLQGSASTQPSTINYTSAATFRVGGRSSSNGLNGYISNLRIVKGTAVYTADFTPPTSPLTAAVTNTGLLTLQERGAYNTIGFQDESEYQHVITRNPATGPNAPAQGSFSPFSPAGWSNYFNGSSYISSTGFNFSTSNFTIEFFINTNSLAAGPQPISGYTTSGLNYAITLGAGGIWRFYLSSNGSSWDIASEVVLGTATAGKWHHIVIVRSGNSIRGYLDGNGGTLITNSAGIYNNSTAFYIGAAGSVGGNLTGYFSNLRVLLGTAAYDPALSNIDVPTAPFATGTTNQVLLTCQANRFIDSNTATTAKTITRSGSPTVQPFSPFKPLAYDPQVHGGSGYFDGSGDYLSIADNAAFTMGSGDFTIEAWVYKTSAGRQTILGQADSGGANVSVSFSLYVSASNKIAGGVNSGVTEYAATSTADIVLNQWNHIAFVRDGSTSRIYINGVQDGTASVTGITANDSANQLAIGRVGEYNGFYWNGYISNCRIVKGVCLYPSGTAFTPPTGPLPLLGNTSLLLNFTNAGVIDSTGKNVIETVGNAGVVTTTIKKYGSGSMFFDGTDDRMVAPSSQNLVFGTGDFTVEGWFYTGSTGNLGLFQISGTTGGLQANQTNNIAVYSNNLVLGAYYGGTVKTGTTAISASTWTHFALVRNSSVTRLYVNGVADGGFGSNSDTQNYTGQNICVGGYYGTSNLFNGYIDDLRITRGYARYTTGTGANANQMVFTGTNTLALPTKALPDRGTSSTLTTDMAAPSSVEALVVAGGGGGGAGIGSGGGAGGFRELVGASAVSVTAGTSYPLTIGAGGPGGASGGANSGSKGVSSVFSGITSEGGGFGAGVGALTNGGPGGSGGGGGWGGAGGTASTSPSGQGNAGGSSTNNSGFYTPGSGGGAGAVGSAGAATGGTNGGGGLGSQSSINGVSPSPYYAGGGGAGGMIDGSGSGTRYQFAGPGGNGGGGYGGDSSGGAPSTSGTSGTANTGGGGGGGFFTVNPSATRSAGGAGGSGVVILAYPTSFRPLKASLGLVYTIDTVTRPGYRVYRFTAGTGNISW